ncbi:hypothetical protein TNCV_2874991 [Trichonephila clavipes]|nr:hypothetical protein TNCV_2874991 [Trichonephila clavipes]
MIAIKIFIKAQLRNYDTIGRAQSHKPEGSGKVGKGLSEEWTEAYVPPPRIRKLFGGASLSAFGCGRAFKKLPLRPAAPDGGLNLS